MKSKEIYLAWQSPDTRDWYVVGQLTQSQSEFTFKYTKGAEKSDKFIPFSGMEQLSKTYVSKELFPLFKNRLLSERRPEYPRFIKWLALDDSDISPLSILARSGGLRGTDQLQTFQKIDLNEDGTFNHYFFVHGLSHLQQDARDRVDTLTIGEKLYLCIDCQNDYDSHAVLIRADKPNQIVGYCPRYLARDIRTLLLEESNRIELSVEALTSDAPSNYKLMCKLSGKVSESSFRCMSSNMEYVPIPEA
ncbi:restriction endonuclease [Vibrio coralliilyticus]|uniref:HIRAN domain-containing protein n=1 Tax=Vibrio coralliilyticus TaxID=190893 RepID=UPI000BAC15A5|nr:HIRAN domain-containing protein [Vibrio coralliilyticus]NOI76201.1 restriction endonuclease [Vibrio coralliilyticus]PAW00974.1 restriction endonuclease [Vibrio coralliilyticus]